MLFNLQCVLSFLLSIFLSHAKTSPYKRRKGLILCVLLNFGDEKFVIIVSVKLLFGVFFFLVRFVQFLFYHLMRAFEQTVRDTDDEKIQQQKFKVCQIRMRCIRNEKRWSERDLLWNKEGSMITNGGKIDLKANETQQKLRNTTRRKGIKAKATTNHSGNARCLCMLKSKSASWIQWTVWLVPVELCVWVNVDVNNFIHRNKWIKVIFLLLIKSNNDIHIKRFSPNPRSETMFSWNSLQFVEF